MPFAIHDGDQIHYEVYGSGPPLIIQHGLFSSAEELSYPQFIDNVSETFQMIFVDSLGHGESDTPDDASRYTRAHRAGDIVAVLDALGIGRAHFFGYSMGGWIGCSLAEHAPDRLKSLCVAGWPISFDLPEGFSDDNFEEFWAAAKRSVFFDNPRAFQRLNEKTEPALKHCWWATMDNQGAIEALKALSCPVMVLCGEDDQLSEGAKNAAEQIGVPFLPVPGNHAQAINQNLGFYFPDVAEFFLKAEEA